MQLALSIEEELKPTYRRKELDRYDSPLWFAPVLLERIPVSGTVLDPCSGSGEMASILSCYRKITDVITNDIDPNTEADFHLDATTPDCWGKLSNLSQIDWVATNPPYNQAFEIVRLALATAQKGVAMALRETWLGSAEERLSWLGKNKPTDIISMPRFHFNKNKQGHWGSDSSAVWWVVWRKTSCTNFHFVAQRDIKYFYLNPDKTVETETVQDYVKTL